MPRTSRKVSRVNRISPVCTLLRSISSGLFFYGVLVVSGCQNGESTNLDQEPVDQDQHGKNENTLHVAVLAWDGYESLPKQGLRPETYRDLIQSFAHENQYEIIWHRLNRFSDLLTSIKTGATDVAVSHITITADRQQNVEFTVPITTTRNWLIGVRNDGRLGIARDTIYEAVAHQEFPDIDIVTLEEGATPDQVADAIIEGGFEATLMDEAIARSVLEDFPTIKKLQELDTPWNYGWAVNAGKTELKSQLNDFIQRQRLKAGQPAVKRSWTDIKGSGSLRMITVNAATTFYLSRGELVGYEYDLMSLFAKSHDLKLDPIVAHGTDEALEFLKEGRGDVVAASLTRTPMREAMNLLFTRSYLSVSEVLVSRDQPIGGPKDLQGKAVHVNPATSFYENLLELKTRINFSIVEREGVSTERLIEEVSDGTTAVTVADSHMFATKAAFNERIKSGMNIGSDHGLTWIVRGDQTQTLERLDEWINENYRGLEHNLAGRRYFDAPEEIREQEERRIRGDVLSQYDLITKGIARRYEFDWRLITSQMFEESRFNPNAVSHAGARGLLQLMPRTALELDIDPDKLSDPTVGIDAGVMYLDWTRNRFRYLSPLEQQWFALAAYNAGIGHVRDARKLSKSLGWDEDKWFDNVEHAMLKLSEPEYYKSTRHGYVRGREPVRYVRNIRDRYGVYLAHFKQLDSQ